MTIALAVPLLCGVLVVACFIALALDPLRLRFGLLPHLALTGLLTAAVFALVVRSWRSSADVEGDPETDATLRWLPSSANRACGVILAMAVVLVAAVAVFFLLGLLAAMVSSPLLAVLLLLLLAAVAGTTALGLFIVRAHRDPQPDLHSAVVVACQGIAWLCIMGLLLFL
jgi:hypothetical protein